MRVAPVPQRDQTGAERRLLVLAAAERGCAGIDLATGALVRCQYPAPWDRVPEAFEVIAVRASPADEQPAYAPESVTATAIPELVGRLRGRKADRYLRPLVHPPTEHLLGSAGASVPFWTLRGDRPSIALVDPTSGPVLERSGGTVWCTFSTRRLHYRLPLHDRHLGAAARHPVADRLEGATLARALGWKPQRLVVALTPPHGGHCYKVVAALLPRP